MLKKKYLGKKEKNLQINGERLTECKNSSSKHQAPNSAAACLRHMGLSSGLILSHSDANK